MSDEKREEFEERFKALSKHRQEEEYFFKRDRELMEALRARADEERRRMERENEKKTHWMRCPKCGARMEELDLGALHIDRCPECHGIYFDDGELEILRKFGEEGGGNFWTKLLSSLKPQEPS